MMNNAFEKQAEFKKLARQEVELDTKELGKDLHEPFDSQQVIEALAKLTFYLKDRLVLYDTILSDDASGRLISRLLREITNKKKEEVGRPNIPIFFLAAGRHRKFSDDSPVGRFLDKKKGALGKTLLVTDYIETGHSMDALAQLLERKNIDFDIATASVTKNPDEYTIGLSKRLYYGEIGGTGKLLHGKYRHAGVIRGSETSAFPRRYTRPGSYGYSEVQETINQTRKDIGVLANRLFDIIGKERSRS